MSSNKTQTKKSDNKYVVVLDEKGTPPVHPSTLFSGRKMGSGKGSVKGRVTSVRTRLALSGSVSSAAAGALSTVINVDPSGSSEWSSFQALYDEVKVHGGVLHWHVGSTGGTPTDSDFAIAYDPTNGGAYTGVAGVLVADQHMLTRAVTQNSATLVGPNTNTRTGFGVSGLNVPKGLLKSPLMFSLMLKYAPAFGPIRRTP